MSSITCGLFRVRFRSLPDVGIDERSGNSTVGVSTAFKGQYCVRESCPAKLSEVGQLSDTWFLVPAQPLAYCRACRSRRVWPCLCFPSRVSSSLCGVPWSRRCDVSPTMWCVCVTPATMSANPPTAATVSKVYDKLRSMGVTSHGVAVKQALLSSRGNVDSAVALLFNRGQVRPPGSQSTATTTTKPKLQASLSQAASTTSAASAPAAADADVSMGGPFSAASAVVTTTTKVQYTENPMFAASKQPRKANSGAGAGAGAGSGASTVASTSGDATAGQGRRPSVATPTSTAKLFESIRVKALQVR